MQKDDTLEQRRGEAATGEQTRGGANILEQVRGENESRAIASKGAARPSNPHPHDQFFKQFLEVDLEGFVDLFYPSLAKQVDFSALKWFDKELFTDIPQGARRESDVVVQARTRDDSSVTFLFLIEIEDREWRKRQGATLPERLFLYYSLLRARYGIAVYPLVLYLFEAGGGLRVHTHRHELLGDVVSEFRFRTIGLPKLKAEEYLEKGSAMAGGLGALMRGGDWSTAEHKVACLGVIGRSEGTDTQKFFAMNCVETYLELTELDAGEYEALIAREEHMEARRIEKTWADRIRDEAYEEGVEKGLLAGKRATLAKQLQLKFGTLSEETMVRLEAITDPQALDLVAEKILTAVTVAELGL